ncbi:hypothetical protein A4H97_23015 [Niastella yeongjuensis]|uniref:DUF4270 domain-containing protein n=1 Tax=Niastella yeongjuensis TaxID=354355 RepID=A0A1V9F7Q8_9BACT|nr:DUF4270 family protein [Niastella yeongjuensis]OQP54355.1 hypothetical protein A4H97_23015 [Niastella yeongjuensis]SEP29615.1 protein of unknown function [Niastella yeongjuensis]
MRIHKRVPFILTYCLLFTSLLSSCYKKDVQVGTELAESHTRIITVDTVAVQLSSYVLDSFTTNNNEFALIGNFFDNYTGKTVASTVFQVGPPTLSEDVATLMPKSAVFDSLVLYMRPSGYYYGDTTKPFAINVNELSQQPDYTFLTFFYNNSKVNILPKQPIGSYGQAIRPTPRDSVKIRLPQATGQDWYDKIRTKATQFANETNFLDYFKGVTIAPATNTPGAVYGFNLADSSVRIRLYFHQTIPSKIDKFLDFIITRTSYQYNRILTDRTGTTLEPTTRGQHEFFASNANPFAITQAGTGVYLKARFPSLRDVLKIDDVVRLMDARLILKPVKGTYDYFTNSLPNPLQLKITDASNTPGSALLDSTGQGIQYVSPFIDFMYGANTSYTFNVTSYINSLLNTSGSQDMGLFIIQDDAQTAKEITRGVMGSRQNTQYETKLVLNILTID